MSWTITILLVCVSGDWCYSYEHCILFSCRQWKAFSEQDDTKKGLRPFRWKSRNPLLMCYL